MSESVTLSLQVDDNGTPRALSADDFKAPATGGSTETTLAAFLAANHTDLTTLAGSLASILAKLSGDPATQTTLAAFVSANHADLTALSTAIGLLAKKTDAQPVSAAALPLPAGAATESSLSAAKADLDSLIATAGSTADAMTAQTMIGLLKKVVDNTSNIKTDLDTIQISDSTISLEVGGVETRLDTSNAALGAPGDTSSANTIIGRLKAMITALGSPAQDATITTATGAAGTSPPALATSASGIVGWLRKIVDTLTGGIGVTGTFWQATQPVSGTVTANAGTGTFLVGSTPTSAAPSTAASVAATTISAAALASNSSAKWRFFENNDSANTVTIKLGSGTVTDYAGIVLGPGGTWDGKIGDSFWTGATAVKCVSGTATVTTLEG